MDRNNQTRFFFLNKKLFNEQLPHREKINYNRIVLKEYEMKRSNEMEMRACNKSSLSKTQIDTFL